MASKYWVYHNHKGVGDNLVHKSMSLWKIISTWPAKLDAVNELIAVTCIPYISFISADQSISKVRWAWPKWIPDLSKSYVLNMRPHELEFQQLLNMRPLVFWLVCYVLGSHELEFENYIYIREQVNNSTVEGRELPDIFITKGNKWALWKLHIP